MVRNRKETTEKSKKKLGLSTQIFTPYKQNLSSFQDLLWTGLPV